MLTLDREEKTALDYDVLNTAIKETFATIDKFTFQVVEEIWIMRDEEMYLNAGYKTFSEYCCCELSAWGGYRRINQLLGAFKVIKGAGEFGVHIKNERQARTLVRLAKEPEKLKAAVELALSSNPSPSESDFAAAANKVVPLVPRKKPSLSEPMVPQSWKLMGSENLSPMVPQNQEPLERRYPKEYSEAIAQIEEQHRQDMERLERDLRIALVTEARALAEAQVKDELESVQKLYLEQKQQNIQLLSRLDKIEAIRHSANSEQQLKQRIEELEHAVEQRPAQQWGNTMTAQATKALNKQVLLALENTIDLRELAAQAPKDNAQECLRLMGMALKNLASTMNNTKALVAAAIILGSEPTPIAIAERAEQLQMLPQAVSDIRRVLVKPGCTWQDFWGVAQEYEVIKGDYLAELTPQETELIKSLEIASSEPDTIGVGSIVAYADPCYTLYNTRGEVVEDLGSQ